MKLYFHFRHTKPSQSVQDHLFARVERLQKFEMKPVTCDVTLKLEGGVHTVELHATGNGAAQRAHGEGEDFFMAIDQAINKLIRQMEKKKAKTKNHKCYERTHEAKLRQLAGDMSMSDEELFELEESQDVA